MKRPLPLILIEDAFTFAVIAFIILAATGGLDQMLGL